MPLRVKVAYLEKENKYSIKFMFKKTTVFATIMCLYNYVTVDYVKAN